MEHQPRGGHQSQHHVAEGDQCLRGWKVNGKSVSAGMSWPVCMIHEAVGGVGLPYV